MGGHTCGVEQQEAESSAAFALGRLAATLHSLEQVAVYEYPHHAKLLKLIGLAQAQRSNVSRAVKQDELLKGLISAGDSQATGPPSSTAKP